MTKDFKACSLCFRLFQQKKGQTKESFAKQEYCPACDIYIRLSNPQQVSPVNVPQPVPTPPIPPSFPPTVPPTPVERPPVKAEAEQMLSKVVDTIVSRPERKAPDFIAKKKGGNNGYVMRTVREACAVYAQMRNMPLESALKLWGLQ